MKKLQKLKKPLFENDEIQNMVNELLTTHAERRAKLKGPLVYIYPLTVQDLKVPTAIF